MQRLRVAHRWLLPLLIAAMCSTHHAAALQSEQALVHPSDGASSALHSHTARALASGDPSSCSHGTDSVVSAVDVLHPTNGAVVKAPLVIQFDAQVASIEHVAPRYARLRACIELDQGAANATHCYPMLGVTVKFDDLRPGAHSLRVLVVDIDSVDDAEQHQALSEVCWSDLSPRARVLCASRPVHFTVLSEREFDAHRSKELERVRQKHQLPPPEHDDLVQWARAQHEAPHHEAHASYDVSGKPAGVDNELHRLAAPLVSGKRAPPHERVEPFVVVGVKTDVVFGFAQRQSIRESWASTLALHPAVRVVFLGCRPALAPPASVALNTSVETLARAIETEKRVFQDLVTHELDCDDSYYALADKVRAFMGFATTAFPTAAYVMATDDDVYLRTHDLVALIARESWPRARLYAGTVAREPISVAPVRDPGHKNYLPVEQYPLRALPPFAYGYHFVLSRDCAQFIGRNRKRLEGLAHLDDVSVALWALSMQVHPRHVPAFKNLDVFGCVNEAISLADLSASAMRIIHANIAAGRPLCSDFNRDTWRRVAQGSPGIQSVEFVSVVERDHAAHATLVTSTIASGRRALSVAYDPSTEVLSDASLHALCLRVKYEVLPGGFACAALSEQLRVHLQRVVVQTAREGAIGSAHLALWTHNLHFAGQSTRLITVVYTSGAMAFKTMLECVLVAAYPHNPVRVLDEAAFAQQQQTASVRSPDIVVFSIPDCGPCQANRLVECQQAARALLERYGEATSLVMVSGEPWTVDGLDDHVLLLSTVSDVPRRRHVYLPMASMVFSEQASLSPMLLLESSAERRQQHSQQQPSEQRKFCAYMYARCDRPQREYMFDLLNAMESVDALGVCQGSARERQYDRVSGRRDPLYNDRAVEIYAQYKFVIAFENAQQRPGYVTEKLTNAFLAGSVPVYLGHSDSVAQVFNAESFIDCGRFATLRACALRVMEVHRSPELYDRMLRAPVVANVTRFHELFSWHPDVPSSHLADAIAAMLRRK